MVAAHCSHGDVWTCPAAKSHVWIRGPTTQLGAMLVVCAFTSTHVEAHDLLFSS